MLKGLEWVLAFVVVLAAVAPYLAFMVSEYDKTDTRLWPLFKDGVYEVGVGYAEVFVQVLSTRFFETIGTLAWLFILAMWSDIIAWALAVFFSITAMAGKYAFSRGYETGLIKWS